MMLVEKVFDTGEILMNYAEGDASGDPLVILHGATLWWKEQQPLIEQLEDSWHIYACELRGHGKSGRAAGEYHLNDYTRDVTRFIRQHVQAPVILIGFSLGGWVAIQAAAESPQDIRAIVLLDPPLSLHELRLTQIQQYPWFSWVYETVRSSSSVEEVAEKCKAFNPALDDAGAAGMAEMIFALDADAVGMLLNDRTAEGVDWTAVYQKITCPALLLWGDQLEFDSSIVRPEDAALFRANVTKSSDFQIKGVGHGIHWGKTAEVVEQINNFLISR